ncbi:MAG: polyamine aminopropyltransferase [Elusimicrobia bacterium]|nr:polyamine aminopropyltransferase [Elusimicrobiota bacterium]
MRTGSSNRKNLWFKEWITPHESHSHRINRVLIKKKTKFQEAVVAETSSFGQCLILDGEMQSAQTDEYVYHESLVHPSLTTHARPERIVILGGGEGATLKEVLKHKTIKKVSMVDIDGEVVEFCKRHFRFWHEGAFDDPRADIVIGDAKKYMEDSAEKFDVILSDLPSPMEGGPAYPLYTIEFYRALKNRLNTNGLFVLQAGSGSLHQIDLHLKLYRTLKEVFPLVRSYSAHVPSFDVPWSFLLCAPSKESDPMNLSAKEVDSRLQKRVSKPLKFYDGMTHEGLFRIPKHLRTALDKEKGIISLKNPVYFFR